MTPLVPNTPKSLIAVLMMAAVTLVISPVVHAQTGCEGDISGDGRTDGVDLAIVLTSWGVCSPASSIDGVYPSSGPVAGGTPIAIVGVDLGATASVTVDGVLCPKFNVVSSTTVTAVTPPGTVGPKALVLRNSQGQQIAAASFIYAVTSLPWATVIEQSTDPAVVTNPKLREAIAGTGLPWRVRDNGSGIEMLLVPPGNFQMGCSSSVAHACSSDENPVHGVTLTNAFYLGRYEVTQAQWKAKIGSNPSTFQSESAEVPAAQVPNRPVEQVTWNMIQDFLIATGMRLPTEAEWECAYRAGTTTAFHGSSTGSGGTNDDAVVGSIAWFAPNSASQTRPVGGKAPNGLGFHDMAGNVYERVADWYLNSYYTNSPRIDPLGPPTGEYRVLRGGSYFSNSEPLRASARESTPAPSEPRSDNGFRVARNP